MSTDLLTQLADYGADHEERQSSVTADEILGMVVPVPVHTTRLLPVRRVAVVLAAAAVVALVLALPLLFARSDVPPAESSTVPATPTTIADVSPTSTTLPVIPDQATVRAAIDSYIRVVNRAARVGRSPSIVDEIEAAEAALQLLAPGPGVPETSEHLRNHTDFLIELSWRWPFTIEECAVVARESAEMACRLVSPSPVHEALGIDSAGRDLTPSIDAIWSHPDPGIPVFVHIDSRVTDAYASWASTNDPETFGAKCAPGAGGNIDEALIDDPFGVQPSEGSFAWWSSFIRTGECGAYLNSITDEVVAALEEAAIASYIDAVNTADLEAAAAAFELLDARSDAPETSERLWNLTEFMIELGWGFTIDECLVTVPEIAEVACGLVVSSPVHEALGIDSVDIYSGDFYMDAIWTNIRRAIPVTLFIDDRVERAYRSWMSRNDPDTSEGACAPDAEGNHDGLPDLSVDLAPADYEFFAYWDVFIYTGECGAYLKSITPQVVASIETANG